MSPDGSVRTTVDGRELTVSNLDKVLYPEAGFTKGKVLDYYARVAEVMVPHLRDRPLTMKRYPDGVDASFFFEKHIPSHAPVLGAPDRGALHRRRPFGALPRGR